MIKKNYTCFWLIYWLLVMGSFTLLLKPNGIHYNSNPGITSLFFSLATIIGLHYFGTSSNIKSKLAHCLLISIIFVITVKLLTFISPLTDAGKNLVESYQFYFPLFTIKTSITKVFDICFQQTMIWSLVFFLKARYQQDKAVIINFLILFTALHLPLFFHFKVFALAFILPSVLAGLLFSFCILKFKKGYLYSFTLHYLFYIFIGLFLR